MLLYEFCQLGKPTYLCCYYTMQYLALKEKLQGMTKGKKKIQSEERKQSSELDSEMTYMQELSDNFMVNMLKALMGKENSMQEKIIYVSREMKTLK